LPPPFARSGALWAWAALVLTLGLLAPRRAGATDPGPDSPEGAVRAAYTELGGLVWAPRSPARDEEIGQLLARNVDFEELTRRAFGEPCPRSGCTDHWAELSPAQQAEVEPLFAAAVTRQWTHELGKASGYDIDVQPALTHSRDTRVRVLARPKGDPGQVPIVIDTFFLANRAPYRLVDVDVDGSRLARGYYKQFDRTLTSPGEGYAYLVSRLRKKVDRGAAARDVDAEAQTSAAEEVDAAPPLDAPTPEPAAKPPPPRSFPWLPVVLGGVAAVGVGVWIGRRGRASKRGRAREDGTPGR
jgi:ABC-type transporter MlaC component